MAARKRARRKSASETKTGSRGTAFRAIAEGLYELQVGRRVIIDVLVTLDGELLTFVRVDGALLAELPVQGQA
jgi:hypothetical protein